MASFTKANSELYHRWEGRDTGPVLVLSHSLGCSSEMWRGQVAALGTHFRILLYDHRGHGRSATPAGPWTIDDFGSDLLNLLDRLELESVHFCGLSLGGMVGLWLAQNAPGRIDRMVLSNTSAKTQDPSLLRNRIRQIEEAGLDAIVDDVLGRWFTDAFRKRNPAVVTEFRTLLEATSDRSYAAASEAICDLDLAEHLSAITCPTLVIYGKHDTATPPSWNLAIANAIPRARSLELPAAHLANLEAAAEFNRALLEFTSARDL